MSRLAYRLTTAAEADMRDIIRYTRKQWSDAQIRRYIKAMDALYPSLRMAHCAHHYVFCLPREHEPALIVAIFHERMHLMTRLADRLAR